MSGHRLPRRGSVDSDVSYHSGDENSSSDEDDNGRYRPTTRNTRSTPQARSPSLSGRLGNLNLGPHTPHTPRPAAGSHQVTPSAPHRHGVKRLIRPEANFEVPKYPADQILLELRQAWEDEDLAEGNPDITLENLFKKAVIDYESLHKRGIIKEWESITRFTQLGETLIFESDVADCVRANVLNPLVAILTSFIKPAYRTRLKCVVRSQQPVKPEQGTHSTSMSPGRLDHGIYLTECVPPPRKDYQLQIPLVIIEEKAPGIIRDRDFKADPAVVEGDPKHRVRQLLPQLFLYASRVEPKCSRFFLTNYEETFGVRIDLKSLGHAVTDLHKNKNKKFCCGKSDVIYGIYSDYGFRVALACEVYLALFELGIADHELVDKRMPNGVQYELDGRIALFIKTQTLYGRSSSHSPHRGGVDFEYTEPPPSP
ncbi:hypothetical protein JCM16303_007069 [Sporobolomyces ruberrimus]